jgi:hypothetical protein
MISLQQLWISDNSLSSSLPPELFSLPRLYYFELDGNYLTGRIPEGIEHLSSLVYFRLDSNYLSSTIPSSFSSLKSLQEILLEENFLTGNIPSNLGSQSTMHIIYLNQNSSSGALPATVFKWVEFMDLSFNTLSGTLPEMPTGSTGPLNTLTINSNLFSGTVPASLIAKMSVYNTGAKYLNIGGNKFEGNISFVEKMKDLVEFAVNGKCTSNHIFSSVVQASLDNFFNHVFRQFIHWNYPRVCINHPDRTTYLVEQLFHRYAAGAAAENDIS